VVQSSGDSGASGTFEISDTLPVIATGAVDNFRTVAMADGYSKYVSNNMAALSSGGTAPTGKVVDLVGPGWYGSLVACAKGSGGCPPNYPVESMRGTSESAPLTSGAAADVIQAYRDTHNGASPTPAVIKQIMTSTATDLDAAADQQGAGLLNIYRAVKAAQQMPGTTDTQGPGDAPSLVASPSQLDVTARGGSTVRRPVTVYNTSDAATTVQARYRALGQARLMGKVVTEHVTAPKAGASIPPEGATAAKTIHFRVPAGLDQLNTKMIWPDSTNTNRLSFQLFNPQGAFVQESYDDGVISRNSIPNIQYAAVQDPHPGQWTAKILWGGVDQDLALPPITPGSYRGTMSFQVTAQHYTTKRAAAPLLIPAHARGTIPLRVTIPSKPGDYPESVQLSAGNGAATSVPLSRRSLIGSHGGTFTTSITSSVGRSVGQISTYQVDVPGNRQYLQVKFHTTDASPNNTYTFDLVDPSGTVAATATSPATNASGKNVGKASLYVNHPVAGQWTIEVQLDLTTSGKEFTQAVHGRLTDPGR
ncbi:MAG: S8 family serine peptidase, partial [Sciscionella sp.]